MTTENKAKKIISVLESVYPDPKCGLEWDGDIYKLTVMAILSAQCTDKKVNDVSKTFFEKYRNFDELAKAEIPDIEKEIRQIGLFHAKAKSLSECAKRIVTVYGGKVPSEMDGLLSLRGVGRKVANLIRGDAFSLGGIVADTHCIRISHRLGLTDSDNPVITERELLKLIPHGKQSDFCHRMVLFGRDVCQARSPKCESCPLSEYCDYIKTTDRQAKNS